NKGDVFIALEGTRTSGAAYLSEAISKGAKAILMESLPDGLDTHADVPVIIVNDLKSRLGLLTSRYYDDPS
ncbi:MAG: UDP-N-acetylmuramoyl-L-alanyl-D-glutamate--2,6-diaminopimelate ligase, partial [Gammaproteobacteria bacterium]|nr:UDP-N-acetylmuramoyl-L-alanyl-D-glutamate--2,6-diaminopimelate ligase [Gammaproteobacteria bacterium]NIO61288.1 UDP-N-acetylmuramoyl-L-alanyl-D-glutamate--2,6-diaminopimelate ligase [Gammaproteobacteria bacterium]